MSIQQENVLEHARRELDTAVGGGPPHLLALYQKFLKIENYRLRLRHQAGGGGREVCASRASLIDILLRHIFAAASAAAQEKTQAKVIPVSLVALGGYGRGELNPASDVDVMFLHPHTGNEVPDSLAQTVEQVLYFLWDIGLKVGHSTRSVREAVAQANSEMLTKTAMLEARHLTGDENLYQRFRAQFRSHCVQGHVKEYIAARMEDQTRRHAKFANNVYLQEPDVKRGCGGLRDYQNLLWITYFKEGALTTTHLVGKDWLSAGDGRRIDCAYDFLLRVRTQLHYTNERSTDVLHLTLQSEIARRLGYNQSTPIARSEAFMKDYYAHTRNIFRITERLTKRFATGTATTPRRLFFPLLPRRRAHEEHFGNFFSRSGQLHVSDPQVFAREPEQIMKAFECAQERKLELSAELSDALSRRLRYVTREFRYGKPPREIFARMLGRKGEVARVLRLMHEADFLGRYPRNLPTSPVSCSTNIFIVIPPMNTPSSASTNSTRCVRARIRNCGLTRDYLKSFPIPMCSISLCFCMTPGKASERGRIPKRARFSRKGWRFVCSSRQNNAARSSSSSTITSRSRTWRSNAMWMTPPR